MSTLSNSLEVLFLILALLIPLTNHVAPPVQNVTSPRDTTFLNIHGAASAQSTPGGTPLASPMVSSTVIPKITLTPDRLGAVRQYPPGPPDPAHRADRPSHKRKSVSFSLSSLEDLNTHIFANKKRPPTPFVEGPISPNLSSLASSGEASPAPSNPVSPSAPTRPTGSLEHSTNKVDSMGVQKSWLMP